MIPSAGDGVRLIRLLAFPVTATVLGLAAHLTAGGSPPSAASTLLAGLVALVAGLGLSRRRRTAVTIAVVLGAVQLVLHEIFLVSAGCDAVMAMGLPGAHPVSAPWMTLAHAAAVPPSAAALARGERLLELLAGWLRPVLRPAAALVAAPPLPPRRARVLVDRAPGLRASLRAAAPLLRRGPPFEVC